MSTKKLNKTLKEDARALGICDRFYDSWGKKETLQQLVEKYLQGIDFCMKHDYPKLDFIREHFPKDLLAENNIFLDCCIDASNLMTAVSLGNAIGCIRYDSMHTGNIYVKHFSEVTVEVIRGAKVFIEVYDNSILHVKVDKNSKAFVYWHGGAIYHEGNVTIRDKRQQMC
jgi:hypothetical protein